MQSKVYARVTDRFLISHLAGETVLMDKQTGDYFGINAVGTMIWELLAHPSTAESIVEQLTQRYEIDPITCGIEVGQFLATLENKKMLLVEY
jgi:Coenzyme PQQ synthesis protein D (PqqD)